MFCVYSSDKNNSNIGNNIFNVAIFINNIPQYCKDIKKFIDKLSIKCFYLEENIPWVNYKEKLYEIIQEFPKSNILVFVFGYSFSGECFYLGDIGNQLVSFDSLYNALNNNTNIVIFSSLIDTNIKNYATYIKEKRKTNNINHIFIEEEVLKNSSTLIRIFHENDIFLESQDINKLCRKFSQKVIDDYKGYCFDRRICITQDDVWLPPLMSKKK